MSAEPIGTISLPATTLMHWKPICEFHHPDWTAIDAGNAIPFGTPFPVVTYAAFDNTAFRESMGRFSILLDSEWQPFIGLPEARLLLEWKPAPTYPIYWQSAMTLHVFTCQAQIDDYLGARSAWRRVLDGKSLPRITINVATYRHLREMLRQRFDELHARKVSQDYRCRFVRWLDPIPAWTPSMAVEQVRGTEALYMVPPTRPTDPDATFEMLRFESEQEVRNAIRMHLMMDRQSPNEGLARFMESL